MYSANRSIEPHDVDDNLTAGCDRELDQWGYNCEASLANLSNTPGATDDSITRVSYNLQDGGPVSPDICILLWLYTEPCVSFTLDEILDNTYSYTIGDPAVIIDKPAPGEVTTYSCSTDCVVEASNLNGHTWFIEESTQFKIVSSDVSLVAGEEDITFTDVSISTNSPGSCSDSLGISIQLINPCKDTTIGLPPLTNQQVTLNDPDPVYYNPGTYTDTVSLSHGDPDFCGGFQFEFWRLDTSTQVLDLITVSPSGDWLI